MTIVVAVVVVIVAAVVVVIVVVTALTRHCSFIEQTGSSRPTLNVYDFNECDGITVY